QLRIRGQGAVPAPGRSFGVIQTMLLVLVNVGLKRMGRENRQGRRPAVGGHRGRNAARTFSSWQECCIFKPASAGFCVFMVWFFNSVFLTGFCMVTLGLVNPKDAANVGSVLRALGCYGADGVVYTGTRYDVAARHHTDTRKLRQQTNIRK